MTSIRGPRHCPRRRQQPGGRQRIFCRCCQRKAKRHQGVEQKVERDIEKSPRIGQASAARQRPVQTVQQAVKHDGDQRRRIPAKDQKRQRQHADGKPGQGQSVGRDARLIQHGNQTIQSGLNPRVQVTVKHGESR